MIVFVNGEPHTLRLIDEKGKDISRDMFNPDSSMMMWVYKDLLEEDKSGELFLSVTNNRIEMSEATFNVFQQQFEETQKSIDDDKKLNDYLAANPKEYDRCIREMTASNKAFLKDIARDYRGSIADLTNQEIWEELFEVPGLNEYTPSKDREIPKELLKIRDEEKQKQEQKKQRRKLPC